MWQLNTSLYFFEISKVGNNRELSKNNKILICHDVGRILQSVCFYASAKSVLPVPVEIKPCNQVEI